MLLALNLIGLVLCEGLELEFALEKLKPLNGKRYFWKIFSKKLNEYF